MIPRCWSALFIFFVSRYIDDHQELYVERLKNAVAIQSVSAWPEKRDEIVKMVKHVASVRQ